MSLPGARPPGCRSGCSSPGGAARDLALLARRRRRASSCSPRDLADQLPEETDSCPRPQSSRRTLELAGLAVPLVEVTGAADGPLLTVIAGVHGCEYASMAGVRRWLRELEGPSCAAGSAPCRC